MHLTLSADDGSSGSGVAETRCVLDPASPTTSFDDLPSSPCPYLGSGSGVATDGEHTLYAASIDNEGNKEAPVSQSFKINQTAPTVSCAAAPKFLLNQTGASVSATVTDATSGPAASPISASADTASVGPIAPR